MCHRRMVQSFKKTLISSDNEDIYFEPLPSICSYRDLDNILATNPLGCLTIKLRSVVIGAVALRPFVNAKTM